MPSSPGGFGTADELFELLTLLQQATLPAGYINAEDLDWLHLVDSIGAAAGILLDPKLRT